MSPPVCFEACSAVIRDGYRPLEVHVMVKPAAYVVGPYPPLVIECPHGVTYLVEPTGEQIAEWVRTGTR